MYFGNFTYFLDMLAKAKYSYGQVSFIFCRQDASKQLEEIILFSGKCEIPNIYNGMMT